MHPAKDRNAELGTQDVESLGQIGVDALHHIQQVLLWARPVFETELKVQTKTKQPGVSRSTDNGGTTYQHTTAAERGDRRMANGKC